MAAFNNINYINLDESPECLAVFRAGIYFLRHIIVASEIRITI